jgi:hypothetical protein
MGRGLRAMLDGRAKIAKIFGFCGFSTLAGWY